MLPVIVTIGVGVGAFLMGLFFGESILDRIKGKRIAVLGEREVGKTTLISYLLHGTLPAEYVQSMGAEKVNNGNGFQLKDCDLRVRDMADVAGGREEYSHWRNEVLKADYVFYLLRGDKPITKRAKADVQQVVRWLEERATERPPQVVLIATYCDRDEAFLALGPHNFADYVERFARQPEVAELVSLLGGFRLTKVMVGSLKSTDYCAQLVTNIFKVIGQP